MSEVETEEELQSLFMEPFKFEGQDAITIQSFHPTDQQLFTTTFRADSTLMQTLPTKPKRKLPSPRNSGGDIGSNICSIPSIPTNERKYGYFEAINGILYPLIDAYQFLREGSVKYINYFHLDCTRYI